jgi:hypothetical protein
MRLALAVKLKDGEQMLEPPGQSEASRDANGGAAAGPGTRWADVDAGEPRRMPGWGHLPAWVGVLTVLAAGLLGAAFTVASHRDPGRALSVFVAAGTLAAGISIRARSAYAIVPVPAIAYATGAVIAGLVHDHALDTSRTALGISAAQWIASGFIAMTATTALAVLLAVARWLLSTRDEP